MYWNDTKFYRLAGAIFLGVLCLLGIIISIIKLPKNPKKHLILLPAYFILILAQIFYSEYIIGLDINLEKQLFLNHIGLSFYISIEEIILAAVLYFSLKSFALRKYLVFTSVCFVFTVFLNRSDTNSWEQYLTFTSMTEMGILITPAAYYFHEIMKNPPTLQLNKEPAFWTTTGILFLIVSLIPSYLSFQFLSPPTRQILDFFAYTLIVVLFIKAISCSHQAPTQKFQS